MQCALSITIYSNIRSVDNCTGSAGSPLFIAVGFAYCLTTESIIRLLRQMSTNIFDPYIYWVCWRSDYLTKLWGFVGCCGDAGLAVIAGFSPTLHLVPSRTRAL